MGYEKSNNLSSFLKVYNKLEQLIVDFGEALTGVVGRYHKGNRPRLLDSLNVLVKSEIVLIELLADVNSLMRYRNGLVHGTDHVVSPG